MQVGQHSYSGHPLERLPKLYALPDADVENGERLCWRLASRLLEPVRASVGEVSNVARGQRLVGVGQVGLFAQDATLQRHGDGAADHKQDGVRCRPDHGSHGARGQLRPLLRHGAGKGELRSSDPVQRHARRQPERLLRALRLHRRRRRHGLVHGWAARLAGAGGNHRDNGRVQRRSVGRDGEGVLHGGISLLADTQGRCRHFSGCLCHRRIQVVAVGLRCLRACKGDVELATTLGLRRKAHQPVQPARREIPDTLWQEDIVGTGPRQAVRAGHKGLKPPPRNKPPLICCTVPMDGPRGALAHAVEVCHGHLCLAVGPCARVVEANGRAAKAGASIWKVVVWLLRG
mmetsp:Transcript_6787/g.13962  ORF Transcript_6787/g.13962 Transcript_6787/m.13962 type:complete len:346 (+) Transcript_6787:112-1149(+)